MIKRLKFGWLGVALALAVILAGSPAFASLSSTFDTGSEGWSLFADGYNLTWVSSGGNPDGFIKAYDHGYGSIWYFVSPDAWDGDWSSYIGGTLSYDIKLIEKGGSYFGADEVQIFSGNNYAAWSPGSMPTPQVGAWESFGVDLIASNFVIHGAGDFNYIMSNVTALFIRGEFISGGDVEGLDNVRIVGPAVPVPGALWLLGSGLAGLLGLRRKLLR